MNLYRQESDRVRKSFTPERIIAKLRQIEVLIGQGHSVAGGCRAAGHGLITPILLGLPHCAQFFFFDKAGPASRNPQDPIRGPFH